MSEQTFPVDDVTLVLLAASCEMNPDSGHTELMRFLDMGSRETTRTLENPEDAEDGRAPIYFVEYEEGAAPFSPHDAIRSLVSEVQRLRALLGEDEAVA